jgi:uncharacterized membrane protein
MNTSMHVQRELPLGPTGPRRRWSTPPAARSGVPTLATLVSSGQPAPTHRHQSTTFRARLRWSPRARQSVVADALDLAPAPSRDHRARRGPAALFPTAMLGAMLVTWAFVMYRLGELRQDRFGTFGFDLGIYGQAAWLVAHGQTPFMTVRGLDVWGHHGTFVFYLLAPGSWLGGGPKWLLFAQIGAQASAAAAIYLLVRDLLGHERRWFGVAGASLLLLNPTQQWMVWEFFHPEAFAVGPLLLSWWALRTQRWRWFALFAIVTASCKEDLALAIAMMGLAHVAASWRNDADQRTRDVRLGAATTLIAIGWYFSVTKMLIPARNPSGAFYEQQFFTDFGTSTFGVLGHVITHPMHFLRFITEQQTVEPGLPTPETGHLEWYRMMLWPTLGLGLLKPRVLAIALPAVGVAMLADQGHNWVRDYRYHYSAIVSAVLVLAAVEAVIDLQQRVRRLSDWRRHSPTVMMSALVVASVVASVLWGAIPVLALKALAAIVALIVLVVAATAVNVPRWVALVVGVGLAATVVSLQLERRALVGWVAVGAVAAVTIAFRVIGTVDADVRRSAIAVATIAAVVGGLTLGGVLDRDGKGDPGTGYWPFVSGETLFDVVMGVDADRDPVAAAKRSALELVPSDARISASYNVVPHLTERRFVYEFPNPFVPSNWGVANESQHDPGTIEVLFIDRALLSSDPTDEHGQASKKVLEHLLTTEFETLFDDGRVVLARRTAAPTCLDDFDGSIARSINRDHYATIEPPSTGRVCPVT